MIGTTNKMIIIEDLEPFEAIAIFNFIKEAVENDDIPYAIQDCIYISDEVKFHPFKNDPDDEPDEALICGTCGKGASDTIHNLIFWEKDKIVS